MIVEYLKCIWNRIDSMLLGLADLGLDLGLKNSSLLFWSGTWGFWLQLWCLSRPRERKIKMYSKLVPHVNMYAISIFENVSDLVLPCRMCGLLWDSTWGTARFQTVHQKSIVLYYVLKKYPSYTYFVCLFLLQIDEHFKYNCEDCVCDKASQSVICKPKKCPDVTLENCTEPGFMLFNVTDPADPCCSKQVCREIGVFLFFFFYEVWLRIEV